MSINCSVSPHIDKFVAVRHRINHILRFVRFFFLTLSKTRSVFVQLHFLSLLSLSLSVTHASHTATTSAHVSNDAMQYQRAFSISTVAKSRIVGYFSLSTYEHVLILELKWVPHRSFGELSHEPYLPGVMEPTS